mmetsp:Transcript_16632/g.17997  ORF Transcript_16632/g.17997 Transcript_16632/m.17997 type:complete len:161 (+) Transcript_16632:186-668(+)
MSPINLCFLVLFLILSILNSVQASTNQTKAICYSGSNLYQLLTQDCNDKDSSYTGEWFCAKMEVCENFISSERTCIVTRGCATAQECSSGSGFYSNQNIQVNGQNPGGMTVTVTCCSAYNFPSDDTIALDYSNICNSASSNIVMSVFALFAVFVFTFVNI